MTNTDRSGPGKTDQRNSNTSRLERRRLWFAVSLVCLLALGVLTASAPIGAAGSGDGELTAASLTDERVERFNAAFPIPNASGVGIQDTAVLDSATETVYVFGAASCTAGEIFEVRVNITQNSTGAVATGDTAAYCLGPRFVQTWISIVEPTGSSEFEAGEAHVDAWARTQRDGETTDTVRWNRSVTVSESYPTGSSFGSQAATPTATEATDSTNSGGY